MPWIPIAVGAGIGLLQAQNKKEEEAKDRALQATTTQYSPYTGMHAAAPERTDTLGMAAGGAAAGAQFGQNMQAAEDRHEWMKKGYSPYTGFGPGQQGFSANNTGPTGTLSGPLPSSPPTPAGAGLPGSELDGVPQAYNTRVPKGYFGFMPKSPYYYG